VSRPQIQHLEDEKRDLQVSFHDDMEVRPRLRRGPGA
jgi:hypothetical protein